MPKPKADNLYSRAEQQAGYFSAGQARKAGYSPSLLSHHTAAGNFVRVAHGVYRLKRFPASPLEDLFVAWLRTGPRSVLSHESALAVYDLSDVIPGEINVTVPRTASRRRPDIRLHTNRLAPQDITWRAGLPVTTVPRTIADVAAAGQAAELVDQAIREALRRGMTDREALQRMAERRGGRAAQLIRKALTPREAE